MTRLSVNINKVALIRNARGGNLPNLVQVAIDCERFGAEGITVHPRPDQRHIRYDDIPLLKDVVKTEFNIEGYPSPEFIDLVIQNRPHQVTLVPDPPGVLTSSEGWNTIKYASFLQPIIQEFQSHNIRVSLFLEPLAEQVEGAKKIGADRIEFYTGKYAETFPVNQELAVASFVEASIRANEVNIGINAGHDLNLDNLNYFKRSIPRLLEVSIGHALISDALYYGLKNTIHMYKRQLSL